MKKKYVWLFLLLLAAAIAVGSRTEVAGFLRRNFAATFSEVLPSEPTKLRARYLKKHPQELNIAVFGPWDYYARQGFILDKAVQLAIDEVNAAGGILGRPGQSGLGGQWELQRDCAGAGRKAGR